MGKKSPCAGVVMEGDSVKRGSLITRGRNGGRAGKQPKWQKEKEKTCAECDKEVALDWGGGEKISCMHWSKQILC